MSKPNSLISGKTKEEKTAQRRQLEENLGLRQVNIAKEIESLGVNLKELESEYEQFFSGMVKIQPTFSQNKFKRKLSRITNFAFKKAADVFRVKAIEQRYQVLSSYWQRITFAKENGTYKKDLFLKDLREKHQKQDQNSQTREGKQNKQMEDFYGIYKRELEKLTGKSCNINFEKFRENMKASAKIFQERNPGKKIKFKIVVKDNQIVIKGESS